MAVSTSDPARRAEQVERSAAAVALSAGASSASSTMAASTRASPWRAGRGSCGHLVAEHDRRPSSNTTTPCGITSRALGRAGPRPSSLAAPEDRRSTAARPRGGLGQRPCRPARCRRQTAPGGHHGGPAASGPTNTSRARGQHQRASRPQEDRRASRGSTARRAPVCSGSQPVTMYCTRSPMFTAWSPMRS